MGRTAIAVLGGHEPSAHAVTKQDLLELSGREIPLLYGRTDEGGLAASIVQMATDPDANLVVQVSLDLNL